MMLGSVDLGGENMPICNHCKLLKGHRVELSWIWINETLS